MAIIRWSALQISIIYFCTASVGIWLAASPKFGIAGKLQYQAAALLFVFLAALQLRWMYEVYIATMPNVYRKNGFWNYVYITASIVLFVALGLVSFPIWFAGQIIRVIEQMKPIVAFAGAIFFILSCYGAMLSIIRYERGVHNTSRRNGLATFLLIIYFPIGLWFLRLSLASGRNAIQQIPR